MSTKKRNEAREKIDASIQAAVDLEPEEDQPILHAALDGLADVAFGIWKALEDIADAVDRIGR